MTARVAAQRNKPREKLYYSITEVGELTGLKPHILRYWETEFPFLRPKRNRAGNRAYRKKDIEMIALIKRLLYDEGYTIEGAKQKIRLLRKKSEEEKPAPAAAKAKKERAEPLDLKELLILIRDELTEIGKMLGD